MSTWIIDPSHSDVQFKVRHLVISNLTGAFQVFEGKIEAEKNDFSDARVSFSAHVDSIFTGNEQRDGHLKSADFFDAPHFPTILFTSSSFQKTGDETYAMTGELTIRGKSLPVKLDVTYGGTAKDFYGNTKAGFELHGKISRKAYGLTWDAVTEAGGVVVADDIHLILSVQVVRQPD